MGMTPRVSAAGCDRMTPLNDMSREVAGGQSHARYFDEGLAAFEAGDAHMTPPENGMKMTPVLGSGRILGESLVRPTSDEAIAGSGVVVCGESFACCADGASAVVGAEAAVASLADADPMGVARETFAPSGVDLADAVDYTAGETVAEGFASDVPAPPGTPEFAVECRAFDSCPMGYRAVKRSFDICFSAVVCAVGLIPGAILCAVIAADTKGAPIYSHERAGRYGRPIRLYKFRSMVADADDVEKYLTPEQIVEWHRERKVTDDPRITRLGAVLRKTSFDELPQFINVLIGQLSVIGPRAITYEELNNFTPEGQRLLLSVPQGITGAWQCGPRNLVSFENGLRQEMELGYVKNACLREDARVFFKTFSVMFGKQKTGR